MKRDQKQQPKTSKKWIDFSGSSDQEDQQTASHNNSDHAHNHKHHHHQKDTQYADKPIPKENLVDNRKQQMSLIKDVKGDSVWFQMTCRNNYQYLLQNISNLQKQKQTNKKILYIYPTVGKQGSAYDVKVSIDLAQQWIMSGFDKKNLIHYEISSRNFVKNIKKDSNNSGKPQFQKKYSQKPGYKQKYQEKYQAKTKKRYIQKEKESDKKQVQNDTKSKQVIKIGQVKKPQQTQINDIKQDKKDPIKVKPKKKKQSKFYSKNPFDEFDQSD